MTKIRSRSPFKPVVRQPFFVMPGLQLADVRCSILTTRFGMVVQVWYERRGRRWRYVDWSLLKPGQPILDIFHPPQEIPAALISFEVAS